MRVPLEQALREQLHLDQQFGIELLEIRSGGPADLKRLMRRHRAGETMTLRFLREGNLCQVTTVL